MVMYPANSGTGDAENQRIIFKAYPGESPVVTGTVAADSQEGWFGSGEEDYITWDGFSGTLIANQGSYETAIAVLHGTGNVIKNCNFTGIDVGSRTQNISFIRVEYATNAVVENNYLHGITGSDVNAAGVWVFESTNTHIRKNTIEDCENGIMQKTGPNNGNEYYQNFIYSPDYCGVFLNEQTGSATGACKIFQNVIVDAYSSIDYGAIYIVSAGYTTDDYQIYNNTIYTAGAGIIVAESCRGTLVWNNLIQNAGYMLRYYSGDAIPSYSDYNGFYDASSFYLNLNYSTNYSTITAWRAATSLDSNSVTSDPGFVNAGGTTAEDYKRSSYTANGRGGAYASVMGAWISDSNPTQIGYSTVPTPAPASISGVTMNGTSGLGR